MNKTAADYWTELNENHELKVLVDALKAFDNDDTDEADADIEQYNYGLEDNEELLDYDSWREGIERAIAFIQDCSKVRTVFQGVVRRGAEWELVFDHQITRSSSVASYPSINMQTSFQREAHSFEAAKSVKDLVAATKFPSAKYFLELTGLSEKAFGEQLVLALEDEFGDEVEDVLAGLKDPDYSLSA